MKSQFLRKLHDIPSVVQKIATQLVVRSSAKLRVIETTATSIDDERNSFTFLLGDCERPPPVKLYKNPRTLFDLWQENEFWISGTKLQLRNLQELSKVKTKVYTVHNFCNSWYNGTCMSI